MATLTEREVKLDIDAKINIGVEKWAGKKRIDIRFWYLNGGTKQWNATKRGVVLPLEKLDELIDGLVSIRNELDAERLGLT